MSTSFLILFLLLALAFCAWIYRDRWGEFPSRAKTGVSDILDASKEAYNKITKDSLDKNADEEGSAVVSSEESNYSTDDKTQADGYKPIVLTKSYRHDKWGTEPRGYLLQCCTQTVISCSNAPAGPK